jgi:hypothetical protein
MGPVRFRAEHGASGQRLVCAPHLQSFRRPAIGNELSMQ